MPNNWTILVVLLFILILVRLFLLLKSKRQKYPYQLKDTYLTPAELSFLNVLRTAVQDKYEIVPQVPLKSIVNVKPGVRNFYTYFNKIDRKVLDFVLFIKSTYEPTLIIELDDSSHNNPDRKKRDHFIDKVVETIKLPILHVSAKYSYSKEGLIQEINTRINQY